MATATARADLEALLRARKLDRTVPSEAPAGVEGVPTGIASLDAWLGTGLPRGELSEVTGPRSSGRGSLVQAALAALSRQGGLAALVDPLDMFDPSSAADAGIVLDRVLWIRGEALSGGRADVLLDRGLKALNLVLQAGGFDLVVFDLAEAPHEAIRRLPFTTWFRLQRAIEGSRTACVLTGRGPIARSAGGVSIQLARTAGTLRRAQGAVSLSNRSRQPAAGSGRSVTSGHPSTSSGCGEPVEPQWPVPSGSHVPGPRAPSSESGAGGTVWAGKGAAAVFAGLEIEARIIRARDPEPALVALCFKS